MTAAQPQYAHAACGPGSTTAPIAAFIAGSRGSSLPGHVERAACRAFANWLGCALGAVGDESVRNVRRVAVGLSGRAQASLVGCADELDVVNAALVNAVAANALDYDDMHMPTLIHPTGPVVAAALALSENRSADGSVLLSAIVVGIEVECRLGLALFPAHYEAGWHITATLGTLGAAAAACVILGLDTQRTQHALGIAATQAGGLRAMLSSACKSFNIGKAAAAGVLAALLAEGHLDSEPEALEARFGLFHVFGRPQDATALTHGLGTRYIVPEISLKPYPCGIVIHPLVDACLALACGRELRAAEVRRFIASVNPRAIELADRQHPGSGVSARYSLQHAAALALTRGFPGLSAFEHARVDDPELVALRNRMVVTADGGIRPDEARAVLELTDGTRIERWVDHPSGSPERPLSDAQFRHKFMELATRAIEQRAAERLHELCLEVHRLKNVTALRQHWAAGSALISRP